MKTKQGYLLLVEDDLDILAMLETTLTFNEYRVLTAQNGREALEAVQREQPLIVIADIMMPHLDGFGLAHRLRLNPVTRHIPVVFITAAYVSPEDRKFALNIGVAEIINKPVNVVAFLKTINELLAGKTQPAINTRNELVFYDEYRKQLETKLEQTTKQISRDEQLLAELTDTAGRDLRVSLRYSFRERDELEHLLHDVNKQLARIGKSE